MSEKEEMAPESGSERKNELTIKFGKGLVGEPFTSKKGSELVEIKIPNEDENDHTPWASFVVSPKMVHENQFGKGLFIKLPADGKTTVSKPVKTEEIGENGKNVWKNEKREVSNAELKSMAESYKERSKGSVLEKLGDKKKEVRDKDDGKTQIKAKEKEKEI